MFSPSLHKIIKHVNPRKITYFDVSMRDGLQSISKIYTFDEKKKMMRNILHRYRPHRMEIGSIVSPKVLPQLADSLSLYNYATKTFNKDSEFFLLVPPTEKYISMAINNEVKNISLITSISNKFQVKNINKTIEDTKDVISKSLTNNMFNYVKLYISCITNCPLDGKQSNDNIVNEICYYNDNNNINEICLSDTCGNMKFDDFKDIIDKLNDDGVNFNKLSLHLHVNPNEIDNTSSIINYCLDNNILKFDVTTLESIGGCSVTMDKRNMNGNLTYTQLHQSIKSYKE